jgi:hypothetical protein
MELREPIMAAANEFRPVVERLQPPLDHGPAEEHLF